MKILIHPHARKRHMYSKPIIGTGRVMDSNREYAPMLGKIQGHWLEVSTAHSNGFSVYPIPGVTDENIGLHIPTVCVGAIHDDVRDHPTHLAIEWVRENLPLWSISEILNQRPTEEWRDVWEELSEEDHKSYKFDIGNILRSRDTQDGWEYQILTRKLFRMPLTGDDMAGDNLTLSDVAEVAVSEFGEDVDRETVMRAVSGRESIKRPYEPLWDQKICERNFKLGLKPVRRRGKLKELAQEGITRLPDMSYEYPDMQQEPYSESIKNPMAHSSVR